MVVIGTVGTMKMTPKKEKMEVITPGPGGNFQCFGPPCQVTMRAMMIWSEKEVVPEPTKANSKVLAHLWEALVVHTP